MSYQATFPTQSVQEPTSLERQQPATATEAVLKIGASATLGNYIVGANGFSLYTFANDKIGISNCTGACATNWPPYIVPAEGARAADSTITGQVGTVQRADGSIQLTYNGMPLYFWIKDVNVGDTTGHGVNNIWFIARP